MNNENQESLNNVDKLHQFYQHLNKNIKKCFDFITFTFFHLFLHQNHNNHQNPHDLVLVFFLICLD